MLSTDRGEFKAQLLILCAGYNVPIGDREEAYWKGLSKMSLIEFARCVEFALGETSPHPDKIPTTGQIWNIRRTMKTASPLPDGCLAPAQRPQHRENLAAFANRLMVRHIIWRHGLGRDELEKVAAIKRKLVLEFAAYVRERDEFATKAEFVRQFTVAIGRVSHLANESQWQKLLDDPRGKFTFPESAVDGIDANGELELA